MNEDTDETISELWHLPFRIAEQSMYFDSLDTSVDLVSFYPVAKGAAYRHTLLMLVVTKTLGNPTSDIIQVPIKVEGTILQDMLKINRDMLLLIESKELDTKISEFIKEQLSKIRTTITHIEQITFRRVHP